MKGLLIRAFNWVFGTDIYLSDIGTIKLLSSRKVHLSNADVEPTQLVTRHRLRFVEANVEAIRLLTERGLQFGEEDVETIRLVTERGLRFGEEDVETIRLVTERGLRFGEEDIETIRLVTERGLRFGEEDVETIRLLAESGMRLENKSGSIRLTGEGGIDLDSILEDLRDGAHLCYSQEGESLILDRLFESQAQGFFVDVGAHHPKRFSNTYSLYKRGWRGINIEPSPAAEELFYAVRPEDVFMPVAVSDKPDTQEFYIFNEPALNTFDKGLADEYQRAGYELIEIRPINAKTLDSVLAEWRNDGTIDLMSIDVEGHELQVLQSNNWARFRPRILLVEILNFDVVRPEASFVHNFLVNQGYALFAKTYNTAFYHDSR